MKWRIYYGTGETFDGETEQDAMQAPSLNVQLYKEQADHLPRGYSLRHGCSFLCWEGWRWSCKNDVYGLMDYFGYHKGPMKVIVGREIYDETYQEIGRQADKDGCFCEGECSHTK